MPYQFHDILIHIGYHKTGTTWLQQELFRSGDKIFEPLSRNRRGQSTLGRLFIKDGEGHLLSPFDANEMSISKELDSLFLEKRDLIETRIPVLSHERLSGNPHSGGFDAKKIASMLHDNFPNAKVLIVIREQRSFLLSNYFQYLSLGGTYNLRKYLNTDYDGRRPYFSPHHVNYVNLVKEYNRLFGGNRVLVLPYEMFSKNPKDFLGRLGEFVEREIVIKDKQFEKVLNKKENHFLMYYLRALGLFRGKTSVNNYSMLSNPVTRLAYKHGFNSFGFFVPNKFNENVKLKLEAQIDIWSTGRYEDSNRELSSLVGIDLAEYGYSD